MGLDEMTAVVTGGAEGIGAGIARRLAAAGMHVVIADLDESAGQATAAQIGGSFVRADVATRAGIRVTIDTARRLSRIGVLVNNAGGIEGPSFPTADPAKWEHTLDLNLRAVMLAIPARSGPDGRSRRRRDHQHRLRRRARNHQPSVTGVRGSQGRGDPVHRLPGAAARCYRRAGQLHLPGPSRHPGLTQVTRSNDASRAGCPPAGAHTRGDSRCRDAVPRRRHPGRADHGMPRWSAQPPAPAHRLADRVASLGTTECLQNARAVLLWKLRDCPTTTYGGRWRRLARTCSAWSNTAPRWSARTSAR